MFLDIETLPAGEENHGALKYLHAKRLAKKNKKEGCDEVKDFEQYLLGTSFDGSFGRILCIGYALDDGPVECLCEPDDEPKMIRDFWELAKDCDLFIGHNILDFDMRFIYQRSIINRVKPPFELNFARYRNSPMFDTMKEWTKWSQNNIGLEHVALALGIPTPKDGIDGSQVYETFKAGKVDEIVEYCKKDVDTTRAIYRRMTFSQ